jgi:hypothetical protein
MTWTSDDGWGPSELPPTPMDTHDCVFIGSALKQIEEAFNVLPNRAAMIAAEGAERGALSIRCRIVFAGDNRMAIVEKWARTPELWVHDMARGFIVELDRRPIPAKQRRPIRVPHWLFVTRESLQKLLQGAGPARSRFNKDSATNFVQAQLKINPNIGMDEIAAAAKAAGKTGGRNMLRDAYRIERGNDLRRGPRRSSAKNSAGNSAKK